MKQRLRQVGWIVLAGVIVISGAWLATGATPAAASRVDCSDVSTCGFGTLVAGPLIITLVPSSPPPPAWSATGVESDAYLNSSGTFSYLYTFPLDSTSSVSLTTITTSSLGHDAFDSSLNWGVFTSTTTSSESVDFAFGPSSFIVFPDDDVILDPGDTLAFYAQSRNEPLTGTISGQDGGTSAFGPSLDPVPEPGSMMLISSGMLGLMGLGLGNFRRKRYSKTGLAVD